MIDQYDIRELVILSRKRAQELLNFSLKCPHRRQAYDEWYPFWACTKSAQRRRDYAECNPTEECFKGENKL